MFLIKLIIAAFVGLVFFGLLATYAQGRNYELIPLVFVLILGGAIAFLFTKLFQPSNKKTLFLSIAFAISLFILVAGHVFSGAISFYVTRFYGYLAGNENEYSYASSLGALFWLGALLINAFEISKPPIQKLSRLWKIYSIVGLILIVSIISFTSLRNHQLIPKLASSSNSNES